MTHKFRSVAFSVVAICAFSGFAAPNAFAGLFHIGASPGVIKGHSEPSQVTTFAFQGAKFPFNFQCPTASLEAATQGQLVQEIAMTPTFGPECELKEEPEEEIGPILQILMNGCKFLFTGSLAPPKTGLVDIAGCTTGKQIQLKTSGCVYEIPAQSGRSHVVAKSVGSNEVTLEWTLSGITVTQSASFCILGDPQGHVTSNATFAGNTIVKAFKSAGTKQVTNHGHQYNENLAGEQVSFSPT